MKTTGLSLQDLDTNQHMSTGLSYRALIYYLVPETITALLLFSALTLVDAKLIADLGSTATYAALGIGTSMYHLLVKIGESFMAATIILGGRANGQGDYKTAGKTLGDALWMTALVGGLLCLVVCLVAPTFYRLHHVSETLVDTGSTFLRWRALGVFLMFLYLAFVGFLRSIKNPRLPMKIFAAGAVVFVLFDCMLVKGLWGFPQLGLIGSAIASVIQYGFMLSCAAGCVFLSYRDSPYQIRLLSSRPNWQTFKKMFAYTWPVIIDKASLMLGTIWIGLMIGKLGVHYIAGFAVLRDVIACACIPGQAGSHVISFLSSNDAGAQRYEHIIANMRKMFILTSVIVGTIFLVILTHAKSVIGFFDPSKHFTDLASWAIFPLSIITIMDLAQLVLAGALRGIGQVKVVMKVRACCLLGFLMPATYAVEHLSSVSESMRFLIIIALFYINFAIMNAVYLYKFSGAQWRTIQERISGQLVTGGAT